MRFKNVNGELIKFTQEEEDNRDVEETAEKVKQDAYEASDKEKAHVEQKVIADFEYAVTSKILEMDNRIRTLEGRGAITFYNLKQSLAALIRNRAA